MDEHISYHHIYYDIQSYYIYCIYIYIFIIYICQSYHSPSYSPNLWWRTGHADPDPGHLAGVALQLAIFRERQSRLQTITTYQELMILW